MNASLLSGRCPFISTPAITLISGFTLFAAEDSLRNSVDNFSLRQDDHSGLSGDGRTDIVGFRLYMQTATEHSRPPLREERREGQNEMAMIEVRNLVKRFKKTEALKGVSFDIDKGDIYGLSLIHI